MDDYKYCPCCGKELERGLQTYPAKYNLPDRVIVTCKGGHMPDGSRCPVDDYTLTPEQHAAFAAKLLKTVEALTSANCA